MTLSNKEVKIRKTHQCFSCWRKFLKGTIMLKWASLHEDNFCSGYTCVTCDKIIEKLSPNESVEEGFVYEILESLTPENYLKLI